MNSVAVILLNFNSTSYTKACVSSILESHKDCTNLKIIVWDSASEQPPTSSDFEIGVDLVCSHTNDGFALGNNKACAYAIEKYDPEYLLLLNNDTRLTKGVIEQLLAVLESDSKVGVVVPKIYFEKNREYHSASYEDEEKGSVIWYGGGTIDWRNMILVHDGVDEVDRGQLGTDLMTTDFATGCCMMVKSRVWQELKGFDPAYFLYYEDADLSERMKARGYKCQFLPSAYIYHINAGSSSGSGSALHGYYQTRSRLRYGLKFAPWRTKIALLNETRRLWRTGSQAVQLGILHGLGGIWGNQNQRIEKFRHSQ